MDVVSRTRSNGSGNWRSDHLGDRTGLHHYAGTLGLKHLQKLRRILNSLILITQKTDRFISTKFYK